MTPKRLSITIDEEMLTKLGELKKEKFYDKSYADMYRYVIQKGLEAAKKGIK